MSTTTITATPSAAYDMDRTPDLTELVEVGQFFEASWGYDQTNVNWYEVVGVTAKSVRLIPCSAEMVGAAEGSSQVVRPIAGSRRTYDSFMPVDRPSIRRARISKTYDWDAASNTSVPRWTVYISVCDYACASLWDGGRVTETAAGWGH